MVISSSLSYQIVNVHIAGLSDTMNPVLCLNENLQKNRMRLFTSKWS